MKEQQPTANTLQPSDFGSLLEKVGDSASVLANLYYQDQRGDKTMHLLQAEAAMRDVPMDANGLAGFERRLVTEAMAVQHAAQSLKKVNDPRAEAAQQAARCVSQIVRATGSINPGVKAMHDKTVAATAEELRGLPTLQRDRDSELALLAHVAAVTPSVLPDFVTFLDRKTTARPRSRIESLFGVFTAAGTVALGLGMGAAPASAADRVPDFKPAAKVYAQPKVVLEPANSNNPENIVPLLDTKKPTQINAAVTSVEPISSQQPAPTVELEPAQKTPTVPAASAPIVVRTQPTKIEKIIPVEEPKVTVQATGVVMSTDSLGLLPDTAPAQGNSQPGDTVVGPDTSINANTVGDTNASPNTAPEVGPDTLTPGNDIMTFLPPSSDIPPPVTADPSTTTGDSGMEVKPGTTVKVKPPEVAVPSETPPPVAPVPDNPKNGKNVAPTSPAAPKPAAPAPKTPEAPAPAPGPSLDTLKQQATDKVFTDTVKNLASQANGAMDGAQLATLINQAAKNNPHAVITREYIMSVLWQESRFNPNAHSAYADGIAQFTPGTAAGRGLANPLDPAQAIDASFKYYIDLYNQQAAQCGGSSKLALMQLAMAAYNAGSGNVINCQVPSFAETQGYVENITATWQDLTQAENNAVTATQKTSDDVTKKKAADDKKAADAAKKADVDKTKKTHEVQRENLTMGQRVVNFAYKFDDYGYLWGGGYDGGDPKTGQQSRPIADIVAIVKAGTNKGEHIVDCGGLLRASFLGELGVDIGAFQFNNGEQAATTPVFTAADGTQYHFINVADKSTAQAGDVFWIPGHVGFITGTDSDAAGVYDTFEAQDPNVAIADNIKADKRNWNDSSQIAMIYRLAPVSVSSAGAIDNVLPAAAPQEQATSSSDKKSVINHQSTNPAPEVTPTDTTGKQPSANSETADGSSNEKQPTSDGLLKVTHDTAKSDATRWDVTTESNSSNTTSQGDRHDLAAKKLAAAKSAAAAKKSALDKKAALDQQSAGETADTQTSTNSSSDRSFAGATS